MFTKALGLAMLAGALAIPAAAQASMPLTSADEIRAFQARYGLAQTGVMDGPTEACAHQRACPPLPADPDGSAGATTSASAICTDGVLSNDRGQNCPDGLYERTYGPASYQLPSGATAPGTYASNADVSAGGYSTPPASIAACESGGDPTTNTGNGFYGKWQFTTQTWQSVTGLPGNASDYPESVQDAAAAKLYAGGAGAGNWPVCSQQ